MKLKFILLLLIIPLALQGQIRLPQLFSDNMVLQGNQPVKVWGEAVSGESVAVVFNGQTVRTKANRSGKWEAQLSAMPYGGPYTMTVTGKKNQIELHNILIGDVWLCSGQSNMEFKLSGVIDGTQEIKNADYPQIRTFNVTRTIGYTPQEDAEGNWMVCSRETAARFSAVAYFYARKIYEDTQIPIGIINSSWGGTAVESWTSIEAYNTLPEEVGRKLNGRFPLENAAGFYAQNEQNRPAYEKALKEDVGIREQWFKPSTTTTDWQPVRVPQTWNLNALKNIDGVVWMRYDFTLPGKAAGEMARLCLGTIGDEDVVWINGEKVGECQQKFIARDYFVRPDILKEGSNTIVVRITDNGIDGGINGRADDVFLYAGNQKYPLGGHWKYKVAVNNSDYQYKSVWRNDYASLTYNAMLHPLLNYAIKGVLWYQGEQNTGKAAAYKVLLPNMINDWRRRWGTTFPFYIIQLPNFRKQDEVPAARYHWAELREAQAEALSLPETGIVITTDLGEAGDLHPRNKKDVGTRAALVALNKTYGKKEIVCSGPVYNGAEVKDNQIILSFSEIGSGLVTHDKYGYLKGFTLAGKDKKHYWAKACIAGDKVVIYYNPEEPPIELAYNWADNPDGTLYNKEGLPAHPFRVTLNF